MKVPRRLKEIVSKQKKPLKIDHEKRGFSLTKEDGSVMIVDTGHIVSLEQWENLTKQIREFVAK